MTIQEATREWFEMEGWDYVEEITYIHPSLDNTFWYNKLTDERIEGLPTIDANYFFDKVVGRIQELCGYTFQHKLEIYFDYVGSTVHCGIFRPDGNFGKKLLAECSGKTEVEAGLQAAIEARKEIK